MSKVSSIRKPLTGTGPRIFTRLAMPLVAVIALAGLELSAAGVANAADPAVSLTLGAASDYTVTSTDTLGNTTTVPASWMIGAAGDIATYTYMVTNTGTTQITSLAFVDEFNIPAASWPEPQNPWACGPTGVDPSAVILDSGDSITCTATYTITPDTLQAASLSAYNGTLVDTATVTVWDGTATGTATGTAELAVDSCAYAPPGGGPTPLCLNMYKQAFMMPAVTPTTAGQWAAAWNSRLTAYVPGGSVWYGILLQDTNGSGTAEGGWTIADLLPAGTTYVSGSAQVIYAGKSGYSDDGCTAAPDPVTGRTMISCWGSQLTANKTATPQTINANQDVFVIFQLVIDNPGGAAGDPCDASTPLPDIVNTATAKVAPSNKTGAAGSAAVAPALVETCGLALTKSASKVAVSQGGETITYTFVATNTGSTTITDASITDDPITDTNPVGWNGLGTLVLDPSCTGFTLTAADTPGATHTCTATYTVDAGDITARRALLDQASVDGTATGGGGGTSAQHADSNTTVVAIASLSLAKSGTPAQVTKEGDQITYTFDVTNDGGAPLSNLAIDDSGVYTDTSHVGFSGSDPLGTITCDPTSLDPGDTATCTATYATTQPDVDLTTAINNTAVATADYDPIGDGTTTESVSSHPSPWTVPVNATADLKLTKTPSPTALSGEGLVGTSVTYTFGLANDGPLTVKNIDLSDTVTAPADQTKLTWAPTCTYGADNTKNTGTGAHDSLALAPGETVSCTATYEVQLADVNNGKIDNTAIANGTDLRTPARPVASNPAPATVPITAVPRIGLTKSPTPANPVQPLTAGSTVTYTLVATNTGNVTLHGVSIADVTTDVLGKTTDTTFSGDPSKFAWTGCTYNASGDSVANGSITLDPQESATCTATYTVQQADADRGSLDNTATTAGYSPTNVEVTNKADASLPQTPEPVFSVTKTYKTGMTGVTATGAPAAQLNDKLVYAVTAQNDGNVTLMNVQLTDQFGSAQTPLALTGCYLNGKPANTVTLPVAALQPDDNVTCTATYAAVTQADVDAQAMLVNVVTGVATPASGGDPLTETAHADVPVVAASPTVDVSKTATPASVNAAGTSVTYTITATNTGNVTLRNTIVTEDPALGASFSGQGVPPQIASCTVNGVPRAITTSAGVPVSSVAPSTTAVVGVLSPGDKLVCLTAPYVTVQADIDAQTPIHNTAVVQDLPPLRSAPDSHPASTQTPVAGVAKVSLTESVDKSLASVNDVLSYTLTATNTGTLTLYNVSLVPDPAKPFTGRGTAPVIGNCTIAGVASSSSSATLAPGQSEVCTASAAADLTYVVTQDDIDAQQNIVHATVVVGTTLKGVSVTDQASALTAVAKADPKLALTLVVDKTSGLSAGDSVVYTYTVTNKGNVRLNGDLVIHPTFSGTGKPLQIQSCALKTPVMSNLLAAPPSAASYPQVLNPGDTVVCVTYPYQTTAADASTNLLTDQAYATATTVATGADVASNTDTAQTTFAPKIQSGGSLAASGTRTDSSRALVAIVIMFGAGAALLWGWRRRRQKD